LAGVRLKRVVVDWTLNNPRYWSGACDGWHGRRIQISINVKRNWLTSKREARKWHKNSFEQFLAEFIDTIVHEYAHAFTSPNLAYRKSERMAQTFAMYGRRTRL